MQFYKDQYLFLCGQLSDCATKQEVKKHNAAMKELSRLFYQVRELEDKSFLLELLGNENERTQSLIAAHCLGLKVYIPEAKKTLAAIAKKSENPIIAFGAQSTLDVWRKQGYLLF